MKKPISFVIVWAFVVAGLISVMIFATDNAEADRWCKEIVDSDNSAGEYNSIAIDSNGYPHIGYSEGYGDRDVKHAKWTGNEWEIEIIDSRGLWTSIAIDNNDHAHLSYKDLNSNLKYAKWNGSGWEIETVDSAGSVGSYSSLEVDSNDFPHISYRDDTGKNLKYAKWNGSGWEIETVDNGANVGSYCSLALDSNDYAHISYHDEGGDNLKYAKWNGTGWEIETVDSSGNVGGLPSLALDSNDHAHIAYQDYDDKDLKHANWTGTDWYIETVVSDGDIGWTISIAIDDTNYPHICYNKESSSSHKLLYISWKPTSWSSTTIDSNQDWDYFSCSLVLNDTNHPHVAYFDTDNSALKYAKRGPFTEPSAPQNLEALGGDSHVNLTWEPPEDDGGARITNYDIYRRKSSETYVSYYKTIGNVTKYTDTDVTNGITYYYELHAVNGVGNSPPSEQKSVTPNEGTLPSAPLDLQAAAGNSQVTLTWSTPNSEGSSPITNYKIYRGTSSGSLTFITDTGDVLTYVDTGLTNDQTYYYKVSAVNGVGEGPKSEEASAKPISGTTINPPSLTDPGSTDDDGIFTMSWSSVTSATNYILEEDDNSEFNSPTIVYSGGATSYHASGKSVSTYYYRVKAAKSGAESGWSNIESITVEITDTDDDGLPDTWEQTYFENLDQGPDDDFDGDEYSNLEEYQAGTSPANDAENPDMMEEDDDESFFSQYQWIIIILVLLIIIVVAVLLRRR